ncbi:hypothetical protein D3C86_184080 [compost metagenome]
MRPQQSFINYSKNRNHNRQRILKSYGESNSHHQKQDLKVNFSMAFTILFI